jgi:midasin
LSEWQNFQHQILRYETHWSRIEKGFVFNYVEGILVKAFKEGYWILLDEINLASNETIQTLSGILDSEGDVIIPTQNDMTPVKRHPNFRIFAAMNPPTDVGKRELSLSLRSRFTEFWCAEMVDRDDVRNVVIRYLGETNDCNYDDIVSIYLDLKHSSDCLNFEGAALTLIDGSGQRPRYSLRTLTRSLKAAKLLFSNNFRPLNRALFEGFLINFCAVLSEKCRSCVLEYLKKRFCIPSSKNLNLPPPRPKNGAQESQNYVLIKPFWLRTGAGVVTISSTIKQLKCNFFRMSEFKGLDSI